MPEPRLLGLAALSGVLFFAAFPPLDRGAVAFVAFVPLLIALHRQSLPKAFFLGWLTGTLGCTALVGGSVYEAASRYFGQPAWLNAVYAFLAPQVYATAYFGAFAAVTALLQRHCRPSAALFLIPSAWVVSEFARSHLGHGAPWVLLGHSQHAHLWIIQIADLTGTFGISFVVMLVNVSAAMLFGDGPARVTLRAARPGLVAGTALLAAVLLYGHWQIRLWESPARSELEVTLVQGNIPQAWRDSLAGAARGLRRLQDLTRGTASSGPDLVVWPENAVGFVLPGNEALLDGLRGTVAGGTRLLLGAPRAPRQTRGRAGLRNSAFLVDARGHLLQHYDKIRLTPFAEYWPWPASMLFDVSRPPRDRYGPGTETSLFRVRGDAFATLICFEAIYPELTRRFVLEGARFLVNISNDDWFAGRPAIVQHFVASMFRSVETRRFLIRGTNTGITAVVTPTGRVAASLPPETAATLTACITPAETLTFYTRYGDVFAWICVVAVIAGGLALRTRHRPGSMFVRRSRNRGRAVSPGSLPPPCGPR